MSAVVNEVRKGMYVNKLKRDVTPVVNKKLILDMAQFKDSEAFEKDVKKEIQLLLEDFKKAYEGRPQTFTLTNVTYLPEAVMTRLATLNLNTHIRLNGHIIKAKDPRRATWIYYAEDFDRENLPKAMKGVKVTLLNGVKTTIGEYFGRYYRYGYYDDKVRTAIFAYNKERIKTCYSLNKTADYRFLEDFYLEVMLIAKRDTLDVLIATNNEGQPIVIQVPSIEVYSPSAKTYMEANHAMQMDLELEDITEELMADPDTIDRYSSKYDLHTPDVWIVRDSKEAWKTEYSPTYHAEDQDMPLGYVLPKDPEEKACEGPKFQGFTAPLESVVYWPDQPTLMKKYYNDTLERNIPKDIRKDLDAQQISPNNWKNTNYFEAMYIETLPTEDQKLFLPLDHDICPVCGQQYNINHGCSDWVKDVFHVTPVGMPDDITPSEMEQDKPGIHQAFSFKHEGCFCQRVEYFLAHLK